MEMKFEEQFLHMLLSEPGQHARYKPLFLFAYFKQLRRWGNDHRKD